VAPIAVGNSVDGSQILAVIKPSGSAQAAPVVPGTRAGLRCSRRSPRCRRSRTSGWRRLARTRRGAPAQPQQAHLPRAHRRAARPRQLPRDRQPAGFATFDEAGEVAEFTPASHVGGQGRIEGRPCIVCADDFTSRGGHADGAIGQKSRYLDRLSIEIRTPSIRLLDGSSGGGSVATMVPKQGTGARRRPRKAPAPSRSASRAWWAAAARSCRATSAAAYYADQLATVPVVNLLLGSVVGIGAAKAVLGHFSVMVRDISQLFVAGPPVVSHAMGYDVTKETWAAGTSTAATARSTTSRKARRRRWRRPAAS
jgi:hypothetical protein